MLYRYSEVALSLFRNKTTPEESSSERTSDGKRQQSGASGEEPPRRNNMKPLVVSNFRICYKNSVNPSKKVTCFRPLTSSRTIATTPTPSGPQISSDTSSDPLWTVPSSGSSTPSERPRSTANSTKNSMRALGNRAWCSSKVCTFLLGGNCRKLAGSKTTTSSLEYEIFDLDLQAVEKGSDVEAKESPGLDAVWG